MPDGATAETAAIDPRKFRDPAVTAKGEQRAIVALTRLSTLWFNTGSLCNITCRNCYMESSPHNDRLAYITRDEAVAYLDEIAEQGLPVEEIGLTGGEPFMNPHVPSIIEDSLERGFRVLVLTNAMKPLWNRRERLRGLQQRFGRRLGIRVSIDHYTREGHESLRGEGNWQPMMDGIQWLSAHGFDLAVAGRTAWGESEADARAGYAAMFAANGIRIDSQDPAALVLFPEMDETQDVPEITTACWDILGVAPETMMCATSRMVVKRKGADRPAVVPCTLLPYDPAFELGSRLSDSADRVSLNHPHCARFCVLGGASCSPGD